MNAIDIVCWIIIGGAVLMVAFIGWTCLVMASRYDDMAEEYWNEYWRKEEMQESAQKAYERYRERFANDYGKTIEEATECQAVKNYKAYLEEQYKYHGVVICEKVGD